MPEPRYIQRNEAGEVVGHYANPQPYARECVAEDHPEILKWLEKIRKSKEDYMRRKAELDPAKLMARIEALEKRLG